LYDLGRGDDLLRNDLVTNEIADPYLRVGELAARLRALGLDHDADALENAVVAGATGTEIFMALRWHLRALLHKAPPADVRAEATALHEFVSRALG
jgi:hypothetical protein